MVLKRKLSRACAFIVCTDLCDELATVDHLAMNSRSTGHLMTDKRTKHTGSCSELHRWSHMYIFFPQSHCKYFLYIHKPATCLPSTNGGQKPNVSFKLSLNDRSAIYCPIKSTPALSLSSDLPLTTCFHLPGGHDLLLSSGEVSATLQFMSANVGL